MVPDSTIAQDLVFFVLFFFFLKVIEMIKIAARCNLSCHMTSVASSCSVTPRRPQMNVLCSAQITRTGFLRVKIRGGQVIRMGFQLHRVCKMELTSPQET